MSLFVYVSPFIRVLVIPFLYQTLVQFFFYLLAVHVLSDEHNLLHAVAVSVVPVACQSWILLHHLAKLFLRHCGIPLSGIAHLNLLASLLEYVAEVLLALEVAETLAADDALRPFLCDNVVELVHVQRTAALVDEGADAVFESFALFLVLQPVMVMVVAMSFLVVMLLVVMVMMLLLVLIIVVMVVVMLLGRVFFLLFLAFDALNPSCGCSNLLEIEFVGVEQLVKIDVAIVACDDVGVRLKLAQYSLYAGKLFGSDLRSLVEENLVAELHLLYDEAGEVFLTDVLR